MKRNPDVDDRSQDIRRALLLIILATLPCYCVALVLLGVKGNVLPATPTSITVTPSQSGTPADTETLVPTEIEGTLSPLRATPTAIHIFPLLTKTRTPTLPTATLTASITPSPTKTPSHTFTPSRTPTASRTFTMTSTPASTDTPTQTPTLAATATLTETATEVPTTQVVPTDTPNAPTNTAIPTATHTNVPTTVPTTSVPPSQTTAPTNTAVPTLAGTAPAAP